MQQAPHVVAQFCPALQYAAYTVPPTRIGFDYKIASLHTQGAYAIMLHFFQYCRRRGLALPFRLK